MIAGNAIIVLQGWTGDAICDRNSIIFLEMHLPFARARLALWRLPPMASRCTGYHPQSIKESSTIVPACLRGALDICIAMTPDLEKYRRYVDRFDLTEAQKAELIHTVWSIMESFVDRAFGIDSVQQYKPSLAKDDPKPMSNRLESERGLLKQQFEQAAQRCSDEEA